MLSIYQHNFIDELDRRGRSVKLATSSQLLVAGYLFREKLATSSQLLVTRKS